MSSNEFPLSRAKITIPGRRPEIVSRARLLTRLDDLLEKKLAFITAPAGYGKTSLLIDLAHTTAMPVCWLTLDELDQEPQRFLSYFIAAITQKFPRFGNQSEAAVGGMVTMEPIIENLIITIVNEIDEHIRQHFIIVLDDYQFVDSVPEIRSFLGRFIQLVGENCHVILASRRLPALPDLPVLVARQQVGGFDLHELAFREEEIRLLFNQAYGVTLAEGDVAELARRTDGWVTGLLLTQMGDLHGIPDLSRAARAVGVDLSIYFEQQVLRPLSPAVRSFLLQSSLLEEFDASLCDAVLGVGDWRHIMADVRRSNLFVLSSGAGGEWMRYHALFQAFLQERLQQESPDTAQAILLRLAEVSEERGDLEKAHYALARVGNQEVLAGLVGRAGEDLIEKGRLLTLAAWLEALPDGLVNQDPRLLLSRSMVALVRGQLRLGLELIEKVQVLQRKRGDKPGLAVALARRSWAKRLLGQYAQAVEDADEAIRLTGEEVVLAEAKRMKGLALHRLGQAQAAEACLREALDSFIQQGRLSSIPLAQMELGMIRRALGDASSARDHYEKALAVWQEQGNLTSQASLLNNLGVLYRLQGDYERAVKAFERGLDCAQRSGYTRSQGIILASLGELYLDLGDCEAAGLLFQQAGDIAAQAADTFHLNYTRVCMAAVHRLKGEHEQARLLLQDAAVFLRNSGSHSENGLLALETGRLLLACGQTGQAIPSLQTAVDSFTQGGMPVDATQARLWLAAAQAQARKGTFQEALGTLAPVLPGLVVGDLSASFLPAGLQVSGWLAPLVGKSGDGLRVRQFLDKAAGFEKGLPSLRTKLRAQTNLLPAAVPDLVIRAFGKPQVRVKGRLVTQQQWQTRSVREMFFMFVHTPGGLTKEQIGEMLWPGSEPGQLKLRFKNELYRLRRAVGQNAVLFDGSSYFFNRNLDYEYDMDTFEQSLRQMRAARDAEEKLRLCQDAIAVVRGRFLEDIDSTWVEADRERYRQEYMRILLSMAGLLLDRRETAEALKLCQYALAADRTLEEAHRMMMRIHAARGDRMGITRQYQACHVAMEEELGLVPSLETEVLYRELTS